MIQLTETELKQIIIDAFNEGLIYDLNLDSPANKYAEYILLTHKSGVYDRFKPQVTVSIWLTSCIYLLNHSYHRLYVL